MLYIRSSLHSIFYCILANPRNPKQLKDPRRESWGFRYFHIWVFSNFENRIIGFNYFSLRKYFILKYMRGENMTSPKIIEILEEKILKSNIRFYLDFIAILFALEKLHVFNITF